MLRFAPLLFALAATLGPSNADAHAFEPEAGTEAAERQPSPDQGTPWGAILAGCVGVAFGGLLAAWQIKGMSKRT
jgi:hypothetical protein